MLCALSSSYSGGVPNDSELCCGVCRVRARRIWYARRRARGSDGRSGSASRVIKLPRLLSQLGGGIVEGRTRVGLVQCWSRVPSAAAVVEDRALSQKCTDSQAPKRRLRWHTVRRSSIHGARIRARSALMGWPATDMAGSPLSLLTECLLIGTFAGCGHSIATVTVWRSARD